MDSAGTATRSAGASAGRLAAALAIVTLAFVALPAFASAATYRVEQGGTDAGDCIGSPYETIDYALVQHRSNAQTDDVIEVGPGTFSQNFAADDPLDDGLTVRGTLSGNTARRRSRATALESPGARQPPTWSGAAASPT